MKPKLFSVTLILIFFSLNMLGQSINAYKWVKIDTTRKISSGEVVKIANRFLNRSYKRIFDAREKLFIDQQLRKLEPKDADKLKIAHQLSSTAGLFTGIGESENASVIFAAKAVILFPSDTMIVNNFGAILRMLDSVKTSLPVLLYAKSLYPIAPVILTNLGNTLFELYDDRSAEKFFKKALQINPDFALARHGLVSVYLKRNDLQKVIEELFKGVAGIYSESLSDVQEKVKYKKSYRPPKEFSKPNKNSSSNQGSNAVPNGNSSGNQGSNTVPNGNSSGNQGSNEPNPNVPIENLQLPQFQDWVDVGAFINDQSLEKLRKSIAAGSASASAKMGGEDLSKLMSRSPDQIMKDYEHKNQPGRVLYKQGALGMELLGTHFEDELDKADRAYFKADSLNTLRMTKSLDQISSGNESKFKQLETNPGMAQELLAENCIKITSLIKDTFADWKKVAGERQNRYNQQLDLYWIYSEPYLNRTYDLNEFEKLNNTRKFFVYSHYSLIPIDYMLRQMTFAVANLAAFATVAGTCPQQPPAPEKAAAKDAEIKVPNKEPFPCPFEHKKLKIGLGICSFGLDCESIEGECGEGMIAGAKWNYKKKELTALVAGGIKADFGIPGSSVSADANIGLEATFNNKGQVIDVGMKTTVSGKASVGYLEAGQAVEVRITIETGIDINRTNELVYKPL